WRRASRPLRAVAAPRAIHIFHFAKTGALVSKIKVKNPIVEMDGDEMTRIIWQRIREQLILPYLDVALKYFDLGVEHRDATNDRTATERANAGGQDGAGGRGARTPPAEAGGKEFNLKKMGPTPTGRTRNTLEGTISREPIICRNVPRIAPHWDKP